MYVVTLNATDQMQRHWREYKTLQDLNTKLFSIYTSLIMRKQARLQDFGQRGTIISCVAQIFFGPPGMFFALPLEFFRPNH